MNPKSYEKNGVQYGYKVNSKKWEFFSPEARVTFLFALSDRTVAGQIASAIVGALKRTKNVGLDALGRGQIRKLGAI